MSQLLMFRSPLPNADRIWAVIAWHGQRSRIANVHLTQEAARADCDWRNRQVHEYRHFLVTEHKVSLRHDIRQIGRTELPRRWVPMPALGFLRGQDF